MRTAQYGSAGSAHGGGSFAAGGAAAAPAAAGEPPAAGGSAAGGAAAGPSQQLPAVTVCDINASMLAEGRRKAEARGIGPESVQVGVADSGPGAGTTRRMSPPLPPSCACARRPTSGCRLAFLDSPCTTFPPTPVGPCIRYYKMLNQSPPALPRPSSQWVEGNAEQLPFDSGVFDSYTVAFGIRNVTDRPAALREAHRRAGRGGEAWEARAGLPPVCGDNKPTRLLQRCPLACWLSLSPACGLVYCNGRPLCPECNSSAAVAKPAVQPSLRTFARHVSAARRVLRPGGRLLCLEFSKVVVPGMQQLYDLYSFNVIPQIGRCAALRCRRGTHFGISSVLQLPLSACLLACLESRCAPSFCASPCARLPSVEWRAGVAAPMPRLLALCTYHTRAYLLQACPPTPPCLLLCPACCRVVAGDAASYQYLVESIRMFPDQESWAGVSPRGSSREPALGRQAGRGPHAAAVPVGRAGTRRHRDSGCVQTQQARSAAAEARGARCVFTQVPSMPRSADDRGRRLSWRRLREPHVWCGCHPLRLQIMMSCTRLWLGSTAHGGRRPAPRDGAAAAAAAAAVAPAMPAGDLPACMQACHC